MQQRTPAQPPELQRSKWSDTKRIAALLVAGIAVLQGSTPFALLVGMPELAWIGLSLGSLFIGASASHVARRLFFPYIDLRQLVYMAVKDGQSGFVVLGVCLVLAALVLVSGPARASDVPAAALTHLPTLASEQARVWPRGDLATMAAQVEQETCPSLTHRKCWNPRAELKTSRERGVGLGQITRTSRFDALTELRSEHMAELKAWAWDRDSLYDPRLQLRALVLKNRGNYARITGTATELDRVAMMLVSYNGGLGRIITDRRICAAIKGCDPAKWFWNVERTSALPKVSTHRGYRSFYEINREYPRRILLERRDKYAAWFGVS